MRSEYDTRRNIRTRRLTGMLAAAVGSLCLFLSITGIATEHPPAGVTDAEYRAADIITSATLPGRSDGDGIILDDQDALDSDATPLSGLEEKQFFTSAGDLWRQHIAVSARPFTLRSISLVEPRFQRYRRLLN